MYRVFDESEIAAVDAYAAFGGDDDSQQLRNSNLAELSRSSAVHKEPGSSRDWNQEYQALIDRVSGDIENEEKFVTTAAQLNGLITDFVSTACRVVEVRCRSCSIVSISTLLLPERLLFVNPACP
jgi:hypothetical protein